jgi:hypothetical protein
MGVWAEIDCARHAAEDPECGGKVFWITGEMFNNQWSTNYELTSCACLLEGVTLDDVEVTSEVGAKVLVFEPEVEKIAQEEPKYKLTHDYTNFHPNIPVCGHVTPGDYAAGPCSSHQVKTLCDGVSGPQESCVDHGITDVATCAATPTFSPVPEPTPSPSFVPSAAPTSQPSEQPTPAPSRTSRRRDVSFLNAFDDIVGSEGNLDEFLIS